MGVENHAVRIVRMGEARKHPNADKLELYDIPGTGFQYVGTIGQFPPGSLAAYIQPDSIVPFRPDYAFLWEGKLSGEGENGIKADYDEANTKKARRIRAKKLRKEWSEGLLIPIRENPFDPSYTSGIIYGFDKDTVVQEGDDVADILGITHYVPPEEPELQGDCEHAPGSKQNKIFPRSFKGWMYFLLRILTFGLYDPNGPTGGANELAPTEFRPIFDVESISNFPTVFQNGEPVVITEKIHGSNARYTYSDEHFYAGSRKLWKKEDSKNIWREGAKQQPWIEAWCRQHPEYTLYGEITPTQKGFTYGCKLGDVRFFVFDIRTPDGNWISWQDRKNLIQDYSLLNWVPVLYEGPYDTEKLALADGVSKTPQSAHIREGVVIRPTLERQAGIHGLGRVILKKVSNEFLSKSD